MKSVPRKGISALSREKFTLARIPEKRHGFFGLTLIAAGCYRAVT
jgi:hypothetical protein